jgi:hypothetical protein
MTSQNFGMNITVEIKNNFGNEAIYPACEKSRVFAEIAGTKTLTRETIEKIKSLGYVVGVAAPNTL